MVRTRTEAGPRVSAAGRGAGDVRAIEAPAPRAGFKASVADDVVTPVTGSAKVSKAPMAVVEVDSSPERVGGVKAKKEPKERAESSSASRSRGRSRSRRRRGHSSSSSSSRHRPKRRVNNFSSVRNVEKERAKTRGYRTAGAAAAMRIMGSEAQGPYFAP